MDSLKLSLDETIDETTYFDLDSELVFINKQFLEESIEQDRVQRETEERIIKLAIEERNAAERPSQA